MAIWHALCGATGFVVFAREREAQGYHSISRRGRREIELFSGCILSYIVQPSGASRSLLSTFAERRDFASCSGHVLCYTPKDAPWSRNACSVESPRCRPYCCSLLCQMAACTDGHGSADLGSLQTCEPCGTPTRRVRYLAMYACKRVCLCVLRVDICLCPYFKKDGRQMTNRLPQNEINGPAHEQDFLSGMD